MLFIQAITYLPAIEVGDPAKKLPAIRAQFSDETSITFNRLILQNSLMDLSNKLVNMTKQREGDPQWTHEHAKLILILAANEKYGWLKGKMPYMQTAVHHGSTTW